MCVVCVCVCVHAGTHVCSLWAEERETRIYKQLFEIGNSLSQVAGSQWLPDATEELWLMGPKLPTWPVGSANS